MNRRRLGPFWILLLLVTCSTWGCLPRETPTRPPESASGFDELVFWERLPLPDDAETRPVVEGVDLGFATRMIEPELFDFYATWLEEQGWQQQAPTEAMVTLPHQRWRKGGAELLIEIQGLDGQGRTVVWLQVDEVR